MVTIPSSAHAWKPTKIRRVVRTLSTGTQAVEVVSDAGPSYAKFITEREGPHVLAAEFIGTKLAELLGLQILDHSVFDYDGFPEVILSSGGKAQSGVTWITRKEERVDWSGDGKDLELLANPTDVAGLVVLDTWTRNCDRWRPAPNPRINRNNVFFSREGAPEGQFRLVAMDHTHILTCGRELTPSLSNIDVTKDETVYGLFPAFNEFIRPTDLQAACFRLSKVEDSAIRAIIAAVPSLWQLDAATREALCKLLINRRDYVASDLPTRIFPQLELL